VAKTSTTHNMGVALAAAGKKVLLIDLDSQAS
jgi:chromosome partitioning protein